MLDTLKNIAFSAFHVVRGRGAGHLAHKKEYHRRRAESERRVLVESRTNPAMFCANVCPACGRRSESAERFLNPVGFSFATCPEDGTVYMDPVPTDATLARLYNDQSYSFHWTEQKDLEQVEVRPEGTVEYADIRRVFRFPTDRKPALLDVGCATGGFLLTAQADFEVEGVELNSDMAQIARGKGLKVTTGRLEDVPGEGRFDVITMLQLIEHIVEPVKLLSAAARLLRPGGIVYFNTPNIDSASFELLRERHMHVSSFGHVTLFTKQSLIPLGERVGLTLLAHEYCGEVDIALHDLVSLKLSKKNFRHRMALYSPRLYHACNLVERLSFGAVSKLLIPNGHRSYQWAILQKPVSNAS